MSDEQDAKRYRALRDSLIGKRGELTKTLTYMPVICDPIDRNISYTRKGLDDILDKAIKELEAIYGL